MVTKLKSKITIIGWLLLFTFGLTGLLSSLDDADRYLHGDYFQTDSFNYEIDKFIDNLQRYELNYLPAEELKKNITVTAEAIHEHRYRYGDLDQQISDIMNQYEGKIENAKLSKNQAVVDLYTNERDQKIQDITNNFKSDEYVRAKIIKEKEEAIERYYTELEKERSKFDIEKQTFKYYLTDMDTGQIYTNLDVASAEEAEKLMKDMLYVREFPSNKDSYLVTPSLIDSINMHLPSIIEVSYIDETVSYTVPNDENHMGQAGKARTFKGKIALSKSPSPVLSKILKEHKEFQKELYFTLCILFLSLNALVISVIIYRKTNLKQYLKVDKLQSKYNNIPIDISIATFLFTAFLTYDFLSNSYLAQLAHYKYIWSIVSEILWTILLNVFFIALTYIQGILLWRRIKTWEDFKREWPTSLCVKTYRGLISLCVKTYRGLSQAFVIRSIAFKVFTVLAIFFASGMGATVVLVEPRSIVIYALLFAIVTLPTIIIIIRYVGYLNLIIKNTEELVKGNLESDIIIKGKSQLAKLAQNINTLKYGVKTSRIEQAKSERLKTELITNVSHDLRTPLTSIINYTGLLKDKNITDEDREAYIEIIDRKSKRLKVLIDDLFDVSKMASGTVELNKERVDLGQLIQQSLAEHNEAISQSSLDFRVTIPNESIFVKVDGQKMWRVFDNLIGNILKYSLENTRVYIQLKKANGKAEIAFKNITKYELPENTDELFERSKRGDTSRHTEGSGLGLAIAKSIIDLHDGHMSIDVDGDLFKVTIWLYLATYE